MTWAAFGAFVASAASFDDRVTEINEAARVAREGNDLQTVEQKRGERWLLIGETAGQTDPPDSPWIRAYKAMELVDGSESSTEEDVGLLNKLRYKEACEVLKQAFDEMANAEDGPLLGEVATRLFEVSQQARGVYRDALVEGSPDQVVAVADIERTLEVAAKRDPCCVSAVAMLLYLRRPDPKEAFLRAEVRESFKQRQKQLVDISHPLVLPAASSSPSGGIAAGAAPAPGASLEHDDAPVMPWHAAVELDKAMSLQYLLADLEYAKELTPDFTLLKGGVPLYTIPGRLFAGTDAELSPTQLLYGQLLLAKTADHQGRRRSAAFYLVNEKVRGKGGVLWDHRYIDLLWRVPADQELQDDPGLRRKHELITAHAARRSWHLGEQEFRIYDFPIRDTERCIREAMSILCIRSIDDLPKLKFNPVRNNPESVEKLLVTAERLARTPFQTSWPVQAAISQFKLANDPTKHSLVELTRSASLNPLVLVSERKSGSKPGDMTPNFFPPESDGESPYLMLDEGRKLHVAVSGREESPCAWVEYDGATAFLPLSAKAIPSPILLGSEIGRAFVGLLKKAGYTEEQAVAEILRAGNESGDYLPEKFRIFMDAKVKAMKAGASKTAVAKQMLAEEGWYGEAALKPVLDRMFQRYGFRYLRDLRGNWIMARSLIDDDGKVSQGVPGAQAQANKAATASLKDYPFAYLAQDGKRAIDKGQIYSWPDYRQLKESIVDQHLAKLCAFHPSLPAIGLLESEIQAPLHHPDENDPEYMEGLATSLSGPGGEAASHATGSAGTSIPVLTAPFPAWRVEGDETQATSLANLYAAYMKRLIELGKASRRRAEIVQRLKIIREARLLASTPDQMAAHQRPGDENERLPSGQSLYSAVERRLMAELVAQSENRMQAGQAILAVQLESGRNYARRKYLHKAIVWYNDFLNQGYQESEVNSSPLIFTAVPTPDTASLFVGQVQRLIEGQRLVINAQVELAGVLNASGLKGSAQFVWQRTIDDYEFFLKPAVETAEELMQSYGLRMGPQAKAATESLDATVELCRVAIAKYDLAVDWRNVRVVGENAPSSGDVPARGPGDMRIDLERDNAGELSDADRERLERECEERSRSKSMSFGEWLEWKKTLSELRPLLAFRTSLSSPPWLACPCSYDAEEGFEDSTAAAQRLLASADASAVIDWCEKPMDASNDEPIAADASTLLGWYWLDMGRLPSARAAYMNLARVKRASAERERSSVEGLVNELHAYVAITAAGAIVESMPGLSGFRADFGGLLEGQLRGWEKRWFAQGAYGPHASEERLELMARATQVRQQLANASQSWTGNRYFFPDYTFEFGAVPDFLAETLFATPERFKELTPEEVKAKGDDAVEGSGWVLVTVAQAEKFLSEQRLDGAIDEKIVFLSE